MRAGTLEQEIALKPKLSIIVPAMRGYDTVLAALDAWEAQTARDQIELIVLCPCAPDPVQIPSGQFVLSTGSLLLHEARSLGIRRASADFIVLAEDHCLPDKSWAHAILARLAGQWDAVGPALRSGNPINSWTQASFLLGYGQWMNPMAGPAAVLPGHNGVIRKSALLELGDELEREMLVTAFLLRRLSSQGCRFFLEARATMRHFDIAAGSRALYTFGCVGLGFGAVRTHRWPWVGRALYALAMPAIAAKHWLRALTEYRRAGKEAGMRPASVAVAAVLSAAWGMGEALGALVGIRRVTPYIALSEIKPVTRQEALSISKALWAQRA